MRKTQIIQHLRRYGLNAFAEATQEFLAKAYSRIHSEQYMFIFIDYLNPLNPMVKIPSNLEMFGDLLLDLQGGGSHLNHAWRSLSSRHRTHLIIIEKWFTTHDQWVLGAALVDASW